MAKNNLDKYHFRIRKLTPTECFRLMDVDEKDIKILTTSYEYDENGKVKLYRGSPGWPKQIISNSKLYQLAGNSIVVACMEHMFENLFYPSATPERGDQLNLF